MRKSHIGKLFRYLGVENSLYHFDELTTRAKWRYKLKLPAGEIKYISFDNDYLNSLKLVTKFKAQRKTSRTGG